MDHATAVNPTLFIAGVNRSGTTALAHSFLNHSRIEVFKDPGKYTYEMTGVLDFSHFFCDPIIESPVARVIKQSIGQYTLDICTIPLLPSVPNRARFMQSIWSCFLIRKPSAVWNSWVSMTHSLRESTDQHTMRTWDVLRRHHAIDVEWGPFGLFELAYSYLYRQFEFFHRNAPNRTTVLPIESCSTVTRSTKAIRSICDWSGIPFIADMTSWSIPFGQGIERLVDGFGEYSPLDSQERRIIHERVSQSSGLIYTREPMLIPEELAEELDSGPLGRYYESMCRYSLT